MSLGSNHMPLSSSLVAFFPHPLEMKQTQLALKKQPLYSRKHNSERMWRICELRLAPNALQQSLKLHCAGHLMLAITPTHYDVISFRTDFLSAQTKPWHPLHSMGQSNSSKVSRGHFIIPRRIDSSWGWLTRRKREKGHGIYNLEYIMHTSVRPTSLSTRSDET